MARMLMLMSHSHGQDQALPLPVVVAGGRGGDRAAPERVFVCKTCNRVFPSFQALGGHRASHKKPRLDGDGDPSLAKPKLHGCSICGLEFAIGQALGGHMRRHRAMASGMPIMPVPPATTRIVDKKPDGDVIIHHGHGHGGVRPGGLWLDLNHPPCADDGCDAEVECGHINAAAAGITFHQFLDTATMAVDCLGY